MAAAQLRAVGMAASNVAGRSTLTSRSHLASGRSAAAAMMLGFKDVVHCRTHTHLCGSGCHSAPAVDSGSGGSASNATHTEETAPGSARAARRIALWTEEVDRQRSAATQSPVVSRKISVQTPQGTLQVDSGVWSPLSLLPEGQAKVGSPIVALVDNQQVWDLRRPLNRDCTVQLLSFETSSVARDVFWHSAAHVAGASVEEVFGDQVRLCDGPSLDEGGFFYEMFLTNDRRLTDEDWPAVHKVAKRIIKSKARFDRLKVTPAFAKEIFADNPFKLSILQNIPCGDEVTLYRCGSFIDLCRGPHVPHTGLIGAMDLVRVAGSQTSLKGIDLSGLAVGQDSIRGDNILLQRFYGMAFPTAAELKDWQHKVEEAKRRDHRLIGKSQQLFFFHEWSPGSAFMLPHGTRIAQKLIELLRREYVRRGYQEVMTPQIFKQELWKTSGHLANYQDAMFMVSQGMGYQDEDATPMGLKPMNCPGHCLMFDHRMRSYTELPVRFADFSPLHRNEASGALGGMTRLRRFHQDDAHIFCREDQIESEIQNVLDTVKYIYDLFHFGFKLRLSTRPEKSMGSTETWQAAETALVQALKNLNLEYTVDEGGGAFYGPKIDVAVTDALGREHQCATVQLDFQLPIRFGLEYTGSDGATHRPVIIHRAILGSVERMMAILIEHTGGRWPFWINPRQVIVCPVADRHQEHAAKIAEQLKLAGYHSEVDTSSNTVNKKVRDAQVQQVSLIAVVGDSELASGQVAVRFRDDATAAAAAKVLNQPPAPMVNLSLDQFQSLCQHMSEQFL